MVTHLGVEWQGKFSLGVCHRHELHTERVDRGGSAGTGNAEAVPAGGSAHTHRFSVRHQAGAVPCVGRGGNSGQGQWAVQLGR